MQTNQYCISPAIVSEHFDDEVIIVNMSRGNYYSLRGSAALVWQGLEAGASQDILLSYLANAYSTDEAVISEPINTFLEQLVNEALLTKGPQSQTSPLPTCTIPKPFTPPVLEIYTDMADLLTLDPIHDVSPVEGWPIKK
ncbi:PqqD family protein [Spirosoma aerolatum]|uniref:PqqD family protein n=1 Tax=Spirosoma aerolatum TaxID=1211326 RepID=UPI0009AC115F|nr:PqqD family protein [Spirosoma aerolatum]